MSQNEIITTIERLKEWEALAEEAAAVKKKAACQNADQSKSKQHPLVGDAVSITQSASFINRKI